jgi:hypothetical protein
MNYHWNGYLKKTIGLIRKGGILPSGDPGAPRIADVTEKIKNVLQGNFFILRNVSWN